jgi:hypothetical protein
VTNNDELQSRKTRKNEAKGPVEKTSGKKKVATTDSIKVVEKKIEGVFAMVDDRSRCCVLHKAGLKGLGNWRFRYV